MTGFAIYYKYSAFAYTNKEQEDKASSLVYLPFLHSPRSTSVLLNHQSLLISQLGARDSEGNKAVFLWLAWKLSVYGERPSSRQAVRFQEGATTARRAPQEEEVCALLCSDMPKQQWSQQSTCMHWSLICVARPAQGSRDHLAGRRRAHFRPQRARVAVESDMNCHWSWHHLMPSQLFIYSHMPLLVVGVLETSA